MSKGERHGGGCKGGGFLSTSTFLDIILNSFHGY